MTKFWFLILTVQMCLTTVQCFFKSPEKVPYQIVPLDYSDAEKIAYLIALYNSPNSSELFGVPVENEKPEYWLYTRASPDLKKLHTWNKTELLQSNFDFTKKTWIIIHGWMGNGNSPNVQDLKTALLNKIDANVIVVDWSKYSVNLYSICRFSINKVAFRFYKFLYFLFLNGCNLNDMSIVGHSLGGHIAGLAARRLGDELIASITGIDVALPLFYDDNPNERLSKTDAKYVEVLHSNAGLLGYKNPIGDTDIYINGGTFQPECGIFIGMCCHVRGFVRYVETIKNDKDYIAYKCTEYESARTGKCPTDVALRIGGITPKSWIEGIYYVSTANW